ncbi:MAG: hypothetical protein P4L61_01660, partial [Candidatus Pacebacteria bacterium]|nr:hypothetical protein [Candidatus Paceibacterota bacterium]
PFFFPRRLFTQPLKVRQHFCEVLAWVLHCADASGIPHSLLEQLMVSTLQTMAESEEQLEKFKNDIQTCSFLVRIGEKDEFRFAHKSFREFFVARKLIADLCAGAKIEKAETSNILSDAKKADVPVSGPVLFVDSFGVGKTSMLAYFRDALNDKMRSSRVFLSMREVEVASVWRGISSDTSIRSHLEAEIRAVFSKQWLSSFSEDVGISEEIATFAIEHASNLSISFKELAEKVSDEGAFDVFCDIVRLAKAPDWVQQNEAQLKEYVIGGKNAHLKIAAVAALIGQSQLITIDFLREARRSLPSEGWSYVLFELASDFEKYSVTLATLYQEDDLTAVDQVICIYGLGGKLPADETNEKMATLVTQLLKSANEKERSLAIKVCSSLPTDKRIAVISQAFKDAESKNLKRTLLAMLEDLSDSESWRVFRGLALHESDPDVRAALKRTEQALRDIQSREKSRQGWDRIKGKKAMRDAIWKWHK